MSALTNVLSKLAQVATNSELGQQHAAVLTRAGNRPITTTIGYNHYESCRYSTDKPSAHAEKVALTKFRRHHQARASNDAKIRRKLKKTSILIARINTRHAQMHATNPDLQDGDQHPCTNQFRNSAPCYHCTALLKSYGVRRVIFTTDGGEPQREKGKSTRGWLPI